MERTIHIIIIMSFVFFTTLLFPYLCLSKPINPNQCFQDDQNALLKIKYHWNNSTLFSSWIPGSDCCTWNGVLCTNLFETTIYRVTTLIVDSGNDIVGTIPSAIGNLPFLDTLIIHENPNLTGPIPRSITKLTNLKSLLLHFNSLTGPLPNFLSKLTSLTGIVLMNNRFTGSIPSVFGQLHNLLTLTLSNNQLTGHIPANLGFMPNLAFLMLDNNMLSGPIPQSLGSLNNFLLLELGGNQFTGDASFLFGENQKNYIRLNLTSNHLSFNLSKTVLPVGDSNSSLLVLDLSHNKIFGGVPAWVGLAPNLTTLDLSFNHLCGPIPKARGILDPFDPLSFEHNKCLCGAPLPPCKS